MHPLTLGVAAADYPSPDYLLLAHAFKDTRYPTRSGRSSSTNSHISNHTMKTQARRSCSFSSWTHGTYVDVHIKEPAFTLIVTCLAMCSRLHDSPGLNGSARFTTRTSILLMFILMGGVSLTLTCVPCSMVDRTVSAEPVDSASLATPTETHSSECLRLTAVWSPSVRVERIHARESTTFLNTAFELWITLMKRLEASRNPSSDSSKWYSISLRSQCSPYR